MRQVARGTGIPLVSCNLIGGNDGLVFDGHSLAFDASGRLVARGRAFAEDYFVVEIPGDSPRVARSEEDVVLSNGRSCSRSPTTRESAD